MHSPNLECSSIGNCDGLYDFIAYLKERKGIVSNDEAEDVNEIDLHIFTHFNYCLNKGRYIQK